MKQVWKINGAIIKEWAAPDDEIVVRPFTEKRPPEGDDITVKGYDWNAEQYITEEVVPVALYEAQQAGFEELAMIVGALCEEVFPEENPDEEPESEPDPEQEPEEPAELSENPDEESKVTE